MNINVLGCDNVLQPYSGEYIMQSIVNHFVGAYRPKYALIREYNYVDFQTYISFDYI